MTIEEQLAQKTQLASELNIQLQGKINELAATKEERDSFELKFANLRNSSIAYLCNLFGEEAPSE